MNVLVVEDEPTISRILERKLVKIGCKVEKADTILLAKEKLKMNFDIVFLDFVLKDGRATDLLGKSRLNLMPKIIMMSAFMEEIDKTQFSDLNIIEFLIKPFDDIDGVLKRIQEI